MDDISGLTIPMDLGLVDHYDLLASPDWKATSVLIVTPYVEREFFNRIVQDLRPKKLIVVIDDGCRAEDVTLVMDSARPGMARVPLPKLIRLALAGKPRCAATPGPRASKRS